MKNISIPKKSIGSRILFFLILFILVCFFYLGVTLALPYNSDQASILLEAKSIIDGNILLKGWMLSSVSFYATEIPFYLLGILLFGYSEKVIYLVTAVNYAILSLVIIYICSTTQDGRILVGRLVISTGFSLFMASLLSRWDLLSAVHIVDFTYCIGSILCLRGAGDRVDKKRLVFWGILLLIAFTGDSFTIYAWGLPVMIVLILKSFQAENRSTSLKFLLTTLVAIALSKIINQIISISGGFSVPGLSTGLKFVDYPAIANNLYLSIIGLFDLFSVNFFGKPVLAYDSGVSMIHLVGLIVFIAAVVSAIKNFRKQTMINQILCLAILMNFGEYLFGNVSVNRGTVRYLLPSLMFGIILVADFISERKWYQRNPFRGVLLSILIGASLIPRLALAMPSLPVTKLDAFLADNSLKYGYGPYWAASISTVHTKGAVSIRPVVSADGKAIGRFDWHSEEDWYTQKATFLVIDSEESFGLNSDTAVNAFGKPNKTYQVDNYSVLVWDKNISPDLIIPPMNK